MFQYLNFNQYSVYFLIRIANQSQQYQFVFFIALNISENTMKCAIKMIEELNKVFWLSGHHPNDFGDYHKCLEHPQMTYFLIEPTGQATHNINAYIGFCLPQQCSKSFVKFSASIVLWFMNLQIGRISTQEDIQNYQYGFSWGFWVTIAISALLFVLAVAGTFWKRAYKNYKVVQAFSIKQNLKYFKYDPNNNFNVIYGIKTFCMSWIIYGDMLSLMFTTMTNIIDYRIIAKKPSMLIGYGTFYAVDVFFFFAGFMLSYSLLRKNIKCLLGYLLAIIHRLVRIWPCFAITICFFYFVGVNLASGPIWQDLTVQTNYCPPLWKAFLLVDNLISGTSICMNWAWYVDCDIQMFISCLVLIFAFRQHKKFGFVVSWLCFIVLTIIGVRQAQIKQYKVIDFDNPNVPDFVANFYIKPWFRVPPYIFGVIVGVLYLDYINQAQSNKEKEIKVYNTLFSKLKIFYAKNRMHRICSELLGVAIMAAIPLILRTIQDGAVWDQIWCSLYLSFFRSIFAFGALLLVLPCMLGLNSFVKSLLCNNFCNVIGKMALCIYLGHNCYITLILQHKNTNFYFTPGVAWSLYANFCVGAVFLGFLMTIFIQRPIIRLQRVILQKLNIIKERKKKVQPLIEQQQELFEKNIKKQEQLTTNINTTIINSETISSEPQQNNQK